MNDSTRLDEKGVSWKILLPAEPDSKICAVSLDQGGLAGLSRSFGKVDTEPVDSLQYDAIVLGNNAEIDLHDLSSFLSCVKPAGVVVNAGKSCFAKQFKDAGFRHSLHYAALSPRKPRLFIPLASGRLTGKGLTFHSPGSFRARVGLSAAKGLNLLGIRHHLMKSTVHIYARSASALNGRCLTHWLSDRLGYPIIDLAIYAGSESPRRKITALAIAEGNNNDVVVKIADTESGADAIKQESQALQAIAASDLSGQAPKLIAEGQWQGYYIQLQEHVSGNNRKQVTRLTDAHLEFLSKLSMIGRKVIPLKETRTWQEAKALTGLNSFGTLRRPVRVALEKVFSDESADMPVVCHQTHGDFVPWNIKVHNGKLFVYDWEDSLPDGLALTDIFHFIYRQASLVGPWPGANNLMCSMTNSAKTLTTLGNLDAFFSKQAMEALLTVWIVQAYLNDPCEHLAELASVLGARLE